MSHRKGIKRSALHIVVGAILGMVAMAPMSARGDQPMTRLDASQRVGRSSSNLLMSGNADHLQRVVDGTVAGALSYFQLKPIAAQGDVTYGPGVSFVDSSVDPFDLTFTLDGGTNERLFFELQMGGWGGAMNVWQATVDWSNSYASEFDADLQRPVVACDSSDATQGEETCRLALGRGSLCRGFMPDTCQDAFVNAAPSPPVGPPGVPDPRLIAPGISAVLQNVSQEGVLIYGSTVLGPPGTPDVGQVGYGGVLAVDIPSNAFGLYTISFVEGPGTFMHVNGEPIDIHELRPAIIDIVTGRCCVGLTIDCIANATLASCDAAGGTFSLGAECTPGACCDLPGGALDCDANGVPDLCELVDADCDGNDLLDVCDLASGAPDCNANGVLDACEIADADCNGNDQLDECDIASGVSADCNTNGQPDECDLGGGFSIDCNFDLIPDDCQPNEDCNGNSVSDICDIGSGTSNDCNFDLVPDDCQPDEDCNSNGTSDICDIGSGTSNDCNSNLSPDSCDIASGDSNDEDGNGRPDECCIPLTGISVERATSRYLSLASIGTPGSRSAIRVTLGLNDSFPEIEGRVLWVGPPSDYPEEDSSNPSRSFVGAALTCLPFFHDWSHNDTLHVFGPEIVPQSLYTVQFVYEGCTGISGPPYSPPVVAETRRLGDMMPPYFVPGAIQPNFIDINADVGKFLWNSDAPIKAAAQLVPNAVTPWTAVSFKDIAAAVQTFLGWSYLDVVSDAQFCDCLSLVTCGDTPCDDDSQCVDGFCMDGFCTDACRRCSP